ncbi:CLUMA_CG015004, isoform A [Clunio marinus]|uniref:CLUMA_CG015004, isoform A n=1 Tax=Clunio marinus TaxID=568069 RepID=A0A1J1IQG9_9DIPT|nr:CLUMA_CG015004, isoform A [Clunio marinus]
MTASLFESSTDGAHFIEFQELQPLHCSKDALTDFFGWLLQGLLAAIAFSCLIAKRFCEPSYRRRPWDIWWYDTSKQGIGAMVIHMTNVYLSPLFKGDPCTWYIINFLLDSTIGLFIIYIGIRICIYLAKVMHWDAINFGEYGASKSWIYQTWIYVFLMIIVKLLTTLIIQMDYWNDVKNLILSPFKNPKLEVVVVMLIIPFFVNVLLFWVTDNFLMRNKKSFLGHHQLRPSVQRQRRGHSILEKVKVKYRTNANHHRPLKKYESESDLLSSEDEPIIQVQEGPSTQGATSKLGKNLEKTKQILNMSKPAYQAGSVSACYVTAPDEQIAKKLAHGIISKKLAACVNIIPRVTSIYEWEGKVNEDSEVLLMIKTKTSRVDDLSKYVRENHPYSVAEVISTPIENENMKILSFIFINFLSYSFIDAKKNDNVYHEELVIKELQNNFVNTYFQFTTRWNIHSRDDLLHTDLLSRSISELFLQYEISEMHVTLTNGLWRHETWGFPIESAGSGAELYVWFRNHLTQDVINRQWIELSGALSGLLCASFSFVNELNTVKPNFSFQPSAGFFNANTNINSSFVRYSALPLEVVCTENLTPWKKLLPCDSKEGLTSLLNAQHIYSTNYHSLGIHVRQLCLDASCHDSILESKQSVNLVHDLRLFGGFDWSIRKLFGQGLNGACQLATSSKIFLDMTDKDFEVTPKPARSIISKRGGSTTLYGEYDIKKMVHKSRQMINIAIVNKSQKTIPIVSPAPLFARRFLQGTGKERGKIVNQISNTHWASLNVIIMENIPWFVPIYLHTLKLKIGDQQIAPTKIKYYPGKQRTRPYLLEVAVKIPARSTLEMSIDFDYIFLKWQEYPPDAHHGHLLPSGVISTLLPMALNYTSLPVEASLFEETFNATRQSYFLRIHTEALLINLPTPDFSMPYNVICLACTVMALAFGPLHNMTTKRLLLQKKDEAKKSLIVKLKEKLFKKKEKSE